MEQGGSLASAHQASLTPPVEQIVMTVPVNHVCMAPSALTLLRALGADVPQVYAQTLLKALGASFFF